MGKLYAGTLKRSKMVNFRLSDDEWQKLQTAAKDHGARSIGDYLRDVVFPNQATGDRVISAALTRITQRLEELQQLKPGARHEAV
jgi:hypothetical protein